MTLAVARCVTVIVRPSFSKTTTSRSLSIAARTLQPSPSARKSARQSRGDASNPANRPPS